MAATTSRTAAAAEAEDEALVDAASAARSSVPLRLRSLQSSGAAPGTGTRESTNANTEEAVHANVAEELDASDATGLQGGQDYVPPTNPPTRSPVTPAPTTPAPTLTRRIHVLRGMAWYDRNGNGVRDSNVDVDGMGRDVEYSHGVGGVRVTLRQCDEGTGRAYEAADEDEENLDVVGMTQGFTGKMVPEIVRTDDDQNAKYNLPLHGLERWFYIEAEAPDGYLFTNGICNDDIAGWECDYDAIVAQAASSSSAPISTTSRPPEFGIAFGRSTSCVYIDEYGEVNSSVNFGVLREGDTVPVNTIVGLILTFDRRNNVSSAPVQERRLADAPLNSQDSQAIGTVAAEVLAATLDERLAREGIVLDKVDSKEVIVTEAGGVGGAAPGSKLAVSLEIRGHYSPPPYVDFDYVVQSSINDDKSAIRRRLRDYNDDCRTQQGRIKQGETVDNFNTVASDLGLQAVSGGAGGVFSTACDAGTLVPEYFETELGDVDTLTEEKLWEAVDRVRVVAVEDTGPLKPWAMGPVAGIAGMIVLLMGVLVFRRALGPRRADRYSASRKTLKLDDKETRRFGEDGGDSDDGSVDSAFYSDPDDDAEIEETEKERKIRRKRKEKAEAQRRGSGGARGSRKNRDRASRRRKEGAGKLAVSQGTNDTDLSDKSSQKSEEAVDKSDKSGRRDKKRSGKERAEKKSSKGKRDRDAADRRKERRGRSKRSGGDNAKAHEEATRIV